MILSEVRDYLQHKGQASLNDIALHFDAEPMAVRGMLDLWIRKGKARKQYITQSCGSSCQACSPAATEIYIWTESAEQALVSSIPAGCNHA